MIDSQWTSEDRAAARAFLQRCEVRLSTLHRVATALLSGAGLMVLLPALMRDQIVTVAGTLLTLTPNVAHVMLAIAASIVMAVPLAVVMVLFGDLTRFYFHGQNLAVGSGTSFAPRFTLTGLMLPDGELSPGSADELARARATPAEIELLVPPNRRGQERIDTKLDAYGFRARGKSGRTDHERAADLLDLVASRPRTLAEEVAKIEYGMARHLLRLQIIVMRYVKSVMAFMVTAIAVFASTAVLERDTTVGATAELRLAAVFAAWAPLMMIAIASPVRWVEHLLRTEGATSRSIANDLEFTYLERVVLVAGAVVLALATAVLLGRVIGGGDDGYAVQIVSSLIVVAAIATFALAVRASIAHPTISRR